MGQTSCFWPLAGYESAPMCSVYESGRGVVLFKVEYVDELSLLRHIMCSIDASTGPSRCILPPEIVLMIIKWAQTYSRADWYNLLSLSRVCKDFYNIMCKNRNNIIEHYTTKEVSQECTRYRFCDLLHSINDLPAMIITVPQSSNAGCTPTYSNRYYWYRHGLLHRDNDKPAVVWNNGPKEWFHNGSTRCNEDQPAVIFSDGMREWYKHGARHRDRDLPAIIYADGSTAYYKHGLLHRDGGRPAVIQLHDNAIEYWVQGKCVRYNPTKLNMMY